MTGVELASPHEKPMYDYTGVVIMFYPNSDDLIGSGEFRGGGTGGQGGQLPPPPKVMVNGPCLPPPPNWMAIVRPTLLL